MPSSLELAPDDTSDKVDHIPDAIDWEKKQPAANVSLPSSPEASGINLGTPEATKTPKSPHPAAAERITPDTTETDREKIANRAAAIARHWGNRGDSLAEANKQLADTGRTDQLRALREKAKVDREKSWPADSGKQWADLSEIDKVSVRLAEMVSLSVQMTAARLQAERKNLSPERKQSLANRFLKYAKNNDIPEGFRGILQVTARELYPGMPKAATPRRQPERDRAAETIVDAAAETIRPSNVEVLPASEEIPTIPAEAIVEPISSPVGEERPSLATIDQLSVETLRNTIERRQREFERDVQAANPELQENINEHVATLQEGGTLDQWFTYELWKDVSKKIPNALSQVQMSKYLSAIPYELRYGNLHGKGFFRRIGRQWNEWQTRRRLFGFGSSFSASSKERLRGVRDQASLILDGLAREQKAPFDGLFLARVAHELELTNIRDQLHKKSGNFS